MPKVNPEFPAELFVRREDERGDIAYLAEPSIEGHVLELDVGDEHRVAVYRLSHVVKVGIKVQITDLSPDDVEKLAEKQ